MKTSSCETCKFRAFAEKRPNSIWAKLWRWHTSWCPGWKAYQRSLAESGDEGATDKDSR